MDLKFGTDMRREGLNTEFKRHYVDDIKATVIAFANTQGGYLYVGIEDDGTACGVSDPDGAVLQIQNALRDSIMTAKMLLSLRSNKEVRDLTFSGARDCVRKVSLSGRDRQLFRQASMRSGKC